MFRAKESVLDSMAEGVIIADPNGKFVFFNPAAERILGIGSMNISPAEWAKVYGIYQTDMVTPYPDDHLPLARSLCGERVVDELLFIRNPERPRGLWISVSAVPIKEHDNSFEGGFALFRDVTGEHNAREDARLLARVFEQTADSVVITNEAGIIEHVNPAFEVTTGFSRDDAVGKTPQILKSGKHDAACYERLWQTITAGETWRGTIVNKKKGGDLYWSEQTISPIRDEDDRITNYVSVLKDITELLVQQEQKFQLGMARQVQQMYYNPRIDVPGFDVAGSAIPAVETGGDYFDFIPITDGSFLIAVGDVAGHGLGAALILAETRALLHAFAKVDADPAGLLLRLNHELVTDLDVSNFATMVIARIEPRERTLVYASAGHPPVYLVGRNGDVRHEMWATGAPLGILREYAIDNSDIISLATGDVVAFFTDGVMEAEATNGDQFGLTRAVEFVKRNREASSEIIVESLHSEVRSFSDGQLQADDITSVICKVRELDQAA